MFKLSSFFNLNKCKVNIICIYKSSLNVEFEKFNNVSMYYLRFCISRMIAKAKYSLVLFIDYGISRLSNNQINNHITIPLSVSLDFFCIKLNNQIMNYYATPLSVSPAALIYIYKFQLQTAVHKSSMNVGLQTVDTLYIVFVLCFRF